MTRASVILAALRRESPQTTNMLEVALLEAGFSAADIASALRPLKQRGLIVHLRRGGNGRSGLWGLSDER